MTQEARGVDASGTNKTVGLEGMKDRTQRRIGVGGQVGPIGLGCMSMSWGYDRGHWDEAASIAVIHRALELGVTLLDTADAYGPFTNEKLVGRAIAGKHAQAFVATKVGLVVDGALNYHRNGRPEHIHGACDASLARLAVDHIDLYQLHRVDPAVPIEDSVGAMSQLVTAGKVRAIGLSEVSVDEASRANAVHPIRSIQSEMSLWTRDPRDNGILDWCAEQGAAFLAYAPLGRGFLTGNIASRHDLPGDDWRRDNPRFTDQAIQANAAIVDTVRDIAAKHAATPAQVALSWLLHQGDHVIPIPGTKTLRYLEQNAGAATLALQPDELATLNRHRAGGRQPLRNRTLTNPAEGRVVDPGTQRCVRGCILRAGGVRIVQWGNMPAWCGGHGFGHGTRWNRCEQAGWGETAWTAERR